MALPGYKINKKYDEKQWAPGFSTGAASGINYQNALSSAIMEYIEIDAFSINWYTERKAKQIDFEGSIMNDIIRKTFGPSDLEPVILYHSIGDINVHTMSSFLINRKCSLPALSAGSQSSLDALHCAYRSLVEAAAVSLLGIAGPIYQPTFFTGKKDHTSIANLDSNVAYYADPSNYQLGKSLIDRITDIDTINVNELNNWAQSDDKKLPYLINELKKISKYAVAINITTPDVESLGYKVVKTFIPELMYMCFPSYPYTNHPRMIKYGGAICKYPHPIP
jgi:thiazole/oxazole-forming peptide maturase SagD family component